MEIVTEENYSKPNAMGKIDNTKEVYTSKVEKKASNKLSGSQKKVPISSAALRSQENVRDTVENNNNNSALIENDDEN